jgi:hypothetical protein
VEVSTAPLEKVYSGATINGETAVTVGSGANMRPLRCLDFFTPGFAWGYHGGAPDELAIAILHDHFGSSRLSVEQRVLALYRAFTDDIVSKFARDRRWSLASALVGKWIDQRERALSAA